MKHYVALARVSSEEQEREGFSLDVQEDALREWAARQGGEIIKMYRVAETAHKSGQRITFHKMLAYARENAGRIDALLFYKVDRAARNMKDWVGLLELRDRFGIQIICITEPFDESPAGKLNGNMMAAISQFYSDQLSIRSQEGTARRVQCGLFPGHAPYGYENYRENGRGLVRVHEERADNVRRIFELYAYHHHTLESTMEQLRREGRRFIEAQTDFRRSKIYEILIDRSYIGEVMYRGQWHPGTQPPLVDRATFDRVQTLIGQKTYSNHESVYGSAMVNCTHCGRPLVCEIKTKNTKDGEREYRYYRCSRYTAKGHPRGRANEQVFDEAVLSMFERLKVSDPNVRRWIENVIRAKTREEVAANTQQLSEIQKRLAQVNQSRSNLLTLRVHNEIDAELYAIKDREYRDELARLTLRLEGQGRQKSEIGDLAIKVFELSQSLKDKWVTADIMEKRRILEIVGLNYEYDGITLYITMRKPFDVLAEGLKTKTGTGGWN